MRSVRRKSGEADETFIGNKRVLSRTLNGVGRTDVAYNSDEPSLVISPAPARRAVLVLEKAAIEEDIEETDRSRTEYGDVEGEIVGLIRYGSKPILTLKEWLSGVRVSCLLSSELARQIGPEHKWIEVWSARRVMISGALHYDERGDLTAVDVDALRAIDGSPVDLEEIRSLDITDGLSPGDHLRRVRGNS